jgi:hypothetical protein
VETERMTGYSGTGSRKGRTPLRPGLTATALLLDSTLFDLEKLEVYQEALAFIAWLERRRWEQEQD